MASKKLRMGMLAAALVFGFTVILTGFNGCATILHPRKAEAKASSTTSNGETGIVTIGKNFNGWFIGSIILGILPAIVDIATGNVTEFNRTTRLPISYSPMIILGENLPYHPDLDFIGNFKCKPAISSIIKFPCSCTSLYRNDYHF